jgi:hypothetical protein
MRVAAIRPRRLAIAGLALATALGGGILTASTAQATTATVSTKTLLSQLTVKAEHSTGYERSKFTLWIDADKDGCNTRYEVLIAEATTKPKVGASCRLTGGRWTSPYDGKRFTSPTGLDIDHLVPLAEAWQSGAWKWTSGTRKAYANDLGYWRSLVAVSATTNRSKGDREPQAWMPAKGKCSYVTSWVAVKWRWRLGVNTSEKTYLTRALASCGWPRIAVFKRATVHTTTTTITTTTTAPSGTDPRFSTCGDAIAAGYGPYTRSDTEYSWYRDSDGDGIVCER